MSGYHEFYRATLIHKGFPLHIVSLWNCVILGIQTIMQHQYGAGFFDHCTKSLFSPTAYIVIFCAFETALLVGVHGTYIQRVVRFNRATMPPDVFRGLSPSLNSVILLIYTSSGNWWILIYFLSSSALMIRSGGSCHAWYRDSGLAGETGRYDQLFEGPQQQVEPEIDDFECTNTSIDWKFTAFVDLKTILLMFYVERMSDRINWN